MLSILTRRAFATKTTKFTGIKALVGCDQSGAVKTIENADIIVQKGRIFAIGSGLKDEDVKPDKIVDLKGALVTPGFVDPHTHLFPNVDRAKDFEMRPTHTYQEIAAAGGGILSSVKATRAATFDQLVEVNSQNVERFIYHGTTTLEIKSGYGLDLENELKQLRVIKFLKDKYRKYIDIVPTFMGAHAFPPEYKGQEDEYVKLLVEEIIPKINTKEEKLAEFCDVFCEIGYFSVKHARQILSAAKKNKMKARLHADEFQDSGAANLAASIGAFSADHLMAIGEKGVEALAKKQKAVATILPGTTIFLGQTKFAPVDKLLSSGVKVAIGTDCNPGSSVNFSQALMMNYAIGHTKMSLEHALAATTVNAAASLNKKSLGHIDVGAQADFIAWNFDSVQQIPYYHSEAAGYITATIKRGKINLRKTKPSIIRQPKVVTQKMETLIADQKKQ